MGVLAEVGWITMDDGTLAHSFAAGAVSVIALLSGLIFYAYTYRKWGPFLSDLKLDLHIIHEDSMDVANGIQGGPYHGGRREGGGSSYSDVALARSPPGERLGAGREREFETRRGGPLEGNSGRVPDGASNHVVTAAH